MLPRIVNAAARLQSLPPHFLLPRHAPPSTIKSLQQTTTRISPPTLTFVRHATHKMSRAANKAKPPAGRRLGMKRASGEYVKIGHIIFRQKGTKWYPGENVKMGRDHTIMAMTPGYVRYYRDPDQPKRKFIGVALHIDQPLPRPLNAARVRRLGFDVQELTKQEMHKFEKAERETAINDEKMVGWVTPTGTYQPRMTGWRIGKFMDEKPVSIQPRNKRGWTRMKKKARRTRFRGARMLVESQAEQPKKARTIKRTDDGQDMFGKKKK